MYLRLSTRYWLNSLRQLQKSNYRLPSNRVCSLLETGPVNDILGFNSKRFCEHYTGDTNLTAEENTSKSATQPANVPSEINTDESGSSSGYNVLTAYLGPYVDDRHWYANTKNVGATVDEVENVLERTSALGKDDSQDRNEPSLEEIRKMLKEKNMSRREIQDVMPKKME